MKQFVILLLLFCSMNVFSQHYETLNVLQMQNFQEFNYCISDDLLGVIIYGEPDCNPEWQQWEVWEVNSQYSYNDSIVLHNDGEYHRYNVSFYGCELGFVFSVIFNRSFVDENPFTAPILWKRQGDPITLSAGTSYYFWEHDITGTWSNGETGNEITVTETGVYSVTLTDYCDSAIYSVEVRDNVELYRATCDLQSNLNMVTWQTTETQAEYVSAVNIYRNTYQLVATVPYLDGSFIDNIGSEATQWQYHIVAVDSDGNECPIPSYWKRTIHLDHIQSTGGGEILQWTPYEEENPAKNTVIYYSIYDVVDGEPHHVMDVGNFTNVYAYDPSDFNGHGTVAAVFASDKGIEDLAFSNLTSELLDVKEKENKIFNLYPNPTTGRVTIEGTGRLTITNTLGQTLLTRDITDTETIDLPMGVWFVKLDGTTRKVVVE